MIGPCYCSSRQTLAGPHAGCWLHKLRKHLPTHVSLVLPCRAGAAAEGGELELGSKAVGNAPLTTRERMRRDRELHRLGLNLVERIPTDVLIDLVQVTCFLMR